MYCKRCGHALSKNSAICLNCGMIMSDEQLKMRKEMNGHNNKYMDKINKLGEEKLKYNLIENEDNKSSNIAALLLIVFILVIIIVIAVLLFLSKR